ncbi:MAG TPA: CHAD domain-containing protein [Candidatus Limnocylindrales bacterium]|nr:CHAD domain-containing protein [Candidatus Limnocylindrales bacterium]
MSEELELKYAIDDGARVVRWLDRAFPPLPGSGWQRLAITDRYFDTADKALEKAGYGGRLRRLGRHTLVTLKSDIEVRGGLHRRAEFEAPATRSLTPRRWPPSEARERLIVLVGERRLIERFVVRQRRREREARLDGALVVLSVDDGRVEVCGTPAGELRQLEIELRSGDEAVLRQVADAVERDGVGWPESRSKLVMAAALAGAAAALRADDALAEAGRKVLRRHLLRMLERETRVRAGDVLALKQMRVATRRMRAAWRTFGEGFRRTEERRYVAELRRVARTLGEVRDLDVLLEGLPADGALARLAQTWRGRRAAAYERLMAMLSSREYGRFVDDHLALTGERGAGVAKRRVAATAGEQARPLIEAAHRRVLDAGAAARGTDDDAAWHALRIAAKRLRYTIEAFRELLDERRAAELIARLVRVQDALGAMNDASVAAREVDAWLASDAAGVAETQRDAVRAYAAALLASVARRRRSFGSVWRGASGVTFARLVETALTER